MLEKKTIKKTGFVLFVILACVNILYISRPMLFGDLKHRGFLKIFLFPAIAIKNSTSSIYNFFVGAVNYASVKKENIILQQKIDALIVENMLLRTQVENEKRQQNVESYGKKYPFSIEVTKVIGRNPQFWYQYLLLEGGKDRGFMPGLPVITRDGLVGKITEVHENYSKLLLLIDPEFSVDVRGERSGVLALCSGIGTSVMKMNYVPKFEDLILGETLTTSGMDGAFPEGIPVGYVIEINKPFGDYFLDAYVIPAVDFLKIREVMVIRSFPSRKHK